MQQKNDISVFGQQEKMTYRFLGYTSMTRRRFLGYIPQYTVAPNIHLLLTFANG
jgi:hypothetical protein